MFSYRFLLLFLAVPVVLAAHANQAAVVDQESDPLPPGAIARLGADRWMQAHVIFAAFLPDGKAVVTANREQSIRVWQFPSGKEIRRIKLPAPLPDPAKKTVGQFTPRVALAKERKIIAINYSGTLVIHFFDLASGQTLATLKMSQELISMAFSPDGAHIAFTATDGSARIWDWANAKEIHTFGQPADGHMVRQLAYSPDGKVIATGHFEKGDKKLDERKAVIKLWDATTFAQVATIGPEEIPGNFSNLTFTPDGKSLAFSSSDKLLIVDCQSGKPVAKLVTEPRKVDPNLKVGGLPLPGTVNISQFVFTRQDGKVYTMFSTGEIAEWDIRTSKMLRKFSRSESSFVVGLSPDDKTLILGGDWWGPQFYDVGAKEITLRTGHGYSIWWLQFLPDAKTLLSQIYDPYGRKSTVQKWNALTGKNLGVFGVEMPPGKIAVSPSGKMLAAAKTTGLGKDKPFVILVDAVSGEEKRRITLQEKPSAIELRFSPDEKTLAILEAKSQTIELYDVATAKLLRTIYVTSKDNVSILLLHSTVFSPDGKSLLWYNHNNSDRAAIYNTATGKMLGPMPPAWPMKAVSWGRQSAAFSPDGRSLIVDLNDATAGLIELATGKLRQTFGKRELPVKPREDDKPLVTHPCLAFSPDGRLLAQSDYDRVIHIWDVSSGKELAAFKGHSLPINAVVFSSDGKTVASGSDDGTALIWDVSNMTKSPVSP